MSHAFLCSGLRSILFLAFVNSSVTPPPNPPPPLEEQEQTQLRRVKRATNGEIWAGDNACVKELELSFVVRAGPVRSGASTCLCVAVKRSILVYEINRTRQRHRRVKEIACPGVVQVLDMLDERLVVGYPSSFAVYSVQGDAAPIGKWRESFWTVRSWF